MVAPRVYHGEYTLQETVILTQLNLNMQARDLERMCNTHVRASPELGGARWVLVTHFLTGIIRRHIMHIMVLL